MTDPQKSRLVVEISARIDYRDPPAGQAEEMMRAQANVMAKATANRLEQAVQLIIAEMLMMQVPHD